MRFKDSLWNDSEPLYAPCLRKIRGKYFWVAPPKYNKLGFAIKTYRLPGLPDDGQDVQRAAQCREMTREMLQWYEGETNGKEHGTWGWLIGRYLHDEFSDIHEVKAITREKYRKELVRIEGAIGSVLISETDYTRIKTWQKHMQDNGRSTSYIKKWFTHWGLALSHGVKIGDAECVRVKTIRSEMRIKTPPRRTVFITREQVDAVVAEADRRGLEFVSLALLIRFEFMLRGVDVYGQWEPAEGRQGGIQHGGRIWADGMTWDMVEGNAEAFSKIISKTRESLTEAYRFDLTAVPEIRRRLLAIPQEQRTGPVIKDTDGLPPKPSRITKAFKTIVRALDLPEELQIRDSRAGGITEAKSLVDPYTLQHAAQHTQQSTTDIYARGRSDAANKVVQMRAKSSMSISARPIMEVGPGTRRVAPRSISKKAIGRNGTDGREQPNRVDRSHL